MPVFEQRARVAATPAQVFAWHERPGAFERLAPDWDRVAVVRRSGGIHDGDEVVLRLRFGPLPVTWHLRHEGHVPGEQFVDRQVRGPFRSWRHVHRMTDDGAGGCVLEDRIEYELPLAPLSGWLAGAWLRRQLARLFAHRHRITCADVPAHQGCRPMKIAVTGSTGLIGSALVPFLQAGGHKVVRLVRTAARPGHDEVAWDPGAGRVDAAALAGVDGVVHLAGENIAGRWTATKKARIRDSRVAGTQALVKALVALDPPPKVLVCASAVGFYGSRGDETLRETSARGSGFLADVCEAWEAATAPARVRGIRVVNPRFGIVLSSRGGALAKMLTPFKLGAGGIVGDGRQWWSWIALDDALGAILHALGDQRMSGPVNAVAGAVTNREFTRTLGAVLRRPTVLPMPAFAVRLLFGEMGDALLLASARVMPEKLQANGYQFRFPALDGALAHALGK